LYAKCIDLLHRGSHNTTLLALSDALRGRLAPFHRPVCFRGSRRLRDSRQAHDRALAAILDSDPGRARRASSGLNAILRIGAARGAQRTRSSPSAPRGRSG